MKVHPVFNVTLLTRAEDDLIQGRAPSEPAPIIVEGHQEYEVKRIINSNWFNKHFQYKVTYKGYGKEHDEWQFRDDLVEDLDKDMLHALEKDYYHQNPAGVKRTDMEQKRRSGRSTIKKK